MFPPGAYLSNSPYGKAVARVMLASSIMSLLALAGQSALFQAGAIILGTFILEDAATVAAAMQVEDGAVSIWLALMSLYAGIVLGDMGLYGLGRLSAYVPWVAAAIAAAPAGDDQGLGFRADLQGRAGQPFPAGNAASHLHHLWLRRRRLRKIHPRGHRRHRLLDQPAVRGLTQAGTIPDGSSGRLALGRSRRLCCVHHPGRARRRLPGCQAARR